MLAGSGTGAWFADKIFGSSVAAMGDQLKVYLQTRVPTIFGVAEERARKLNLELRPIKPGLLAKMIMDASFSDESPQVTEWWSNLFLSASHTGTNKHAVFSDMMAVIGPAEATCLRDFIESFDFGRTAKWFKRDAGAMRGSIDLMRHQAVEHWVGKTPVTEDRMGAVYLNLTRGQIPWPLRPTAWTLPAENVAGEYTPLRQSNPWFRENQEAIEILERTRVMKFARVNIPVMGPSSWVDTVELTSLGVDFYIACRGYEFPSEAAA